MFICFDMIHELDRQTDGRTERHRMTAIAALEAYAQHRAAKTASIIATSTVHTPNLTTVTLYTTIFQTLKQIDQRF